MVATILLYFCLIAFFLEMALHFKLTPIMGLSLSNLSVYMLSAYWLVKSIYTRVLIKPSNINLWLILFMMVMLLSIPIKLITQETTLTRIAPDLILFKSLIINAIIYFVIFYNVIDNNKVAHKILNGLVVLGIVSGIYSILAAKGIIVDKSKMSIEGRVMGFSEPNQYAAFLAMMIPATISQVLKDNGLIARMFFATGFMILFFALVLSGSRGGYLALIVGLICFLIVSMREQLINPGKSIVIVGFVLIACIASISFSPKEFKEGMSKKISLSESSDIDKFSSGRTKLLSNGIQLFMQSPFYGHGFNTYIEENKKQFRTHALSHNEYLALSVEQGIIGLIIYLIINIKIITGSNKAIKAIKDRSDKIVVIGMMSGAISYMVAITFVNIIDVKRIFWSYVAILLSINYYALRNIDNSNNNAGDISCAEFESAHVK